MSYLITFADKPLGELGPIFTGIVLTLLVIGLLMMSAGDDGSNQSPR